MKRIGYWNGKLHVPGGTMKAVLVFWVLIVFSATQGVCKDLVDSASRADDQAFSGDQNHGENPAATTKIPTNEKNLEALIQLLKEKGLISETEAVAFLQRLHQPEPESGSGDPGTTTVEGRDVEDLDKEIEKNRKQIDRTLDSLLQRDRLNERRLGEIESKVYDEIVARQTKTSWAERIKLSGDLRLRHQSDMYDENNSTDIVDPGNITTPLNTTDDRSRYRYRARVRLDAKIIDPREVNAGKVDLGIRLATGNEDDPISTNETMGDYFNKDSIVVDRAFLKWSWQPIEEKLGRLPKISLVGGRFANPFFSTDLVWDRDLNLEGFSMQLASDTLLSNSWSVFLNAGAFPLEELELRQRDKWLYGGQIGLVHRPFWGMNYKLAVAYYDFQNTQVAPLNDYTEMSTVEDWDWSEPGYRQRGNSWAVINPFDEIDYAQWKTGLASDFNELNITAMIDIDRLAPVHVIFWGDYVKNLGYDRDEMEQLEEQTVVYETALEDQSEGYSFGVELGYPLVRNWGDWKLGLFYKHLEADAVVDAFTDSDFHGGGTDAEGYIIKLLVGLYKNVWLESRYMSTNEIYEDEDDPSYYQLAIDVFQLDINVVF